MTRLFPAALYLAAFALFIVAFVELTSPAHPVHATLEIVAGASLFLLAEVVS